MPGKVDARGYVVETSQLSKKRLREICNELTVRPVAVVEYAKPKPFKIFRTADDVLVVPRAFGDANFGKAPTYDGPMGAPIGLTMAPGFRLDPERFQPDAVEAIMRCLSAPYGGGLVNLFTGAGKTVIGCAVIQRMQLKTLILVHKSFLLEQWIERLTSFLPGVRIGKIQGAHVDVDCDVCIGMIQSIAIKEEGSYADVFASFGLLIVDECHVVCTKVFSKALQRAQTRYAIGLSATLQRKDKLERVIHHHLGDVLFTAERQNMTAQVRLVYADVSNVRELINPKTQKPDRVGMVTNLVNDPGRNRLIVQQIQQCAEQGRKILVLSERRQHLTDMLTLLAEAGCTDAGLYVGGMPQDQLKATEEKSVIAGTFSMASTGLDIKNMSTLVLASPLTDITQACGRILRNHTDHSKLIIDIVDRASVFIGQMRRRVASYHKQNFSVRGDEIDDTLRQTRLDTNSNSVRDLAIV